MPNPEYSAPRPHREPPVIRLETPEAPPELALEIPAAPDEAADLVKIYSVEGRPADARAGPLMLWIELGLFIALILGAALLVVWWLGPAPGMVAFGFGVLALLFNPVVATAMLRTRERAKAVAMIDRARSVRVVPREAVRPT